MIKKIYKMVMPERMRNQVRMIIKRVQYPFYLGNSIECNCCGKSFRKMLPKGDRLNAECPYCGALERTRVLLHYLVKNNTFLTERKNESHRKIRVLHFAPEPSLFKLFSKLNIEYIDADLNPAYANHIVDITNIQYKENYFDYILCSHVVAHVPNEKKALKELYRVLAPNGRAIILTYINPDSYTTIDHDWINTPELRKQYYGEPDCLRLHGGDFILRLKSAGFEVSQIDFRSKLGKEIVQRNALGQGPREWIFECRKK